MKHQYKVGKHNDIPYFRWKVNIGTDMRKIKCDQGLLAGFDERPMAGLAGTVIILPVCVCPYLIILEPA
jgi:hypothetical protein